MKYWPKCLLNGEALRYQNTPLVYTRGGNKTLCTILVPTQKNEKSIFSSSKKFVLNNNRDSIESRPQFSQRDSPKYTENNIQSTENSIQSKENSKRTYKIFSRIGTNKNLEPNKPFLKIDIKSNSLF